MHPCTCVYVFCVCGRVYIYDHVSVRSWCVQCVHCVHMVCFCVCWVCLYVYMCIYVGVYVISCMCFYICWVCFVGVLDVCVHMCCGVRVCWGISHCWPVLPSELVSECTVRRDPCGPQATFMSVQAGPLSHLGHCPKGVIQSHLVFPT